MDPTHHPLIAGVLATLAILCAVFGVVMFRSERRARDVQRRLVDLMDSEPDVKATVVRDMKASAFPALDRLLRNVGFVRYLERVMLQAGMTMRPATLILLVLCVTCLAAYLAVTLTRLGPFAPLLGLPPGCIPLFYVHWKKQKRAALFDRQFPDALDLMTSALRAGLAFTGAIQVVAEESPDPIAKEFRIVFDENRLGLDARASFNSLSERVDSTELRLFVTAVMLQRETGGNLVEILEGTAAVIRDRLRILGDVRTITAQGRLSGLILSALPIIMACVLTVLAPDYMKILITHPIGRYLIAAAVFLQLAGYLAIRRITAIKV